MYPAFGNRLYNVNKYLQQTYGSRFHLHSRRYSHICRCKQRNCRCSVSFYIEIVCQHNFRFLNLESAIPKTKKYFLKLFKNCKEQQRGRFQIDYAQCAYKKNIVRYKSRYTPQVIRINTTSKDSRLLLSYSGLHEFINRLRIVNYREYWVMYFKTLPNTGWVIIAFTFNT